MMSFKRGFLLIIAILKILSEIACFICICIICSLNRKNQFETHFIGNLDLYFNDVEITSNKKNLIPNNIIYKNSINKRLIKMLSKYRYKKKNSC